MSGLIPVIMCGGAGTRLWPVSRESMPKQFVPLVGDRSTFQQTLDARRRSGPVRAADRHHQCATSASSSPSNCASSASRPISCSSRCGAIPDRRSRSRPRSPRSAIRRRPCWCSPPTTSCASRMNSARPAAARPQPPPNGLIVTFGIKPTRPATNYGYIRPGAKLNGARDARGRCLRREAGRRDRVALRRRELSLEQRQLPVPRRRDAGRDRALRARDGGGRARRGRRRDRAISTSCASPPSRSRARRRNRSTTR